MSYLKTLSLALLFLVLHGCAFIHSLDENLPQQVDTWMQNQEYSRVIDTLAYIRSDHPHYQKLAAQRALAQQKSIEYEAQILAQAKQQLEKQLWQEAHKTYQEALRKLPGNVTIQQALEAFTRQRDIYLKQLSYQALMNNAQAVVQNNPIHKEIVHTAPDSYHYRKEFKRHATESANMRGELLDCAEYYLSIRQLSHSQRCLELAAQLNTEELPPRYHELETRLAPQLEAQSRRLSATAQTHLSAAEHALENKQLNLSLAQLEKIPAEEQDKAAISAFRKRLDTAIQQVVQQETDHGRRLYSEGKIQEALEAWQAVRLLDPSNPNLRRHIERAQRVLKKLESLGSDRSAEPE
ncbi:MAG: hypothetical protein R6X06_06535 [Gammaproteobacteria bacterium]